MTLYDYIDYKKYLVANLEHGEAKKFAQHIGCQPPFLSRVLKDEVNLSLEQGFLANSYFHHSPQETEYFMQMLHYARAGTNKLRDYYHQQLTQANSERKRLQKQLESSHQITDQFRSEYYSSAYYSLCHILVSVLKQTQVDQIAKLLHLEIEETKIILHDLQRFGVIKQRGNAFEVTQAKIHARKEEVFSVFHNRNIRNWMLGQMQKKSIHNFHFTNVIGVSHKDYNRILDLLSETTRKMENIIAPSPEECAGIVCIDAINLNPSSSM